MTTKQLQIPAAKTCLVCGKSDKTMRRGLCISHYQQFIDARNSLPDDVRTVWETRQIELGKVLPSRPGRHAKSGNYFAESAAEFLAQHQSSLAADRPLTPHEQAALDEATRLGSLSGQIVPPVAPKVRKKVRTS